MKHAKSRTAAAGAILAALLLGIIAAPNIVAADQSASSLGREESCVLDSTSRCTLLHGQATAPLVFIQEKARGQNVTVDWVSNTEYRLSWLWHDGRGFKAGTVVKFYVHFDTADVVPSPTPTPTVTPSPTPTPTPTVTPTPGACTNPQYTTSGAGANGDGTWDNQGYLVNNNVWSPQPGWAQTLNACAFDNWYVVANQPGDGTDDGVKSYPDTQKNVDIPLGSMGNIQSTFNVGVPAGGGTVPARGPQWNAAYDMWLNGLGNVEVMIWTTWTMNWQYWYGVRGGEQVTIDGVAYHAMHVPNATGNSRAMWFIRDGVGNVGSQDIDGVLRWAVSKGWLTNTDRLSAIEYGFEIAYTGGAPMRFDLLDYTLTTG